MNEPRTLIDSHGRTMSDIRISVTDRCNFRCMYCLPETEAALNFYRGRWASLPDSKPIAHQWKPRHELLTFEEIERMVQLVVPLGINKIRLTGGEPMLRHDMEVLIEKLAGIDGIKDLAMTTNGLHFLDKGFSLKKAGLNRISFSLDSLDPAMFKKMTGRDALGDLLKSIRYAKKLGMQPVKVNAVIIRDLNDGELEALTEFARTEDIVMRFIEFMPLDSGRVWQKELVVPARDILQRIRSTFQLEPLAPNHPSETARRWGFPEGQGEIGIVAPVSEPFCGHCNRLRLTSDGKVRTCLFSVQEHDARTQLRDGTPDEAIQTWLQDLVWNKEAGHRIGQSDFISPERSMSCIGG